MGEEKKCTRCGESYPLSAFCKHSIAKDGLSHWCAKCRKEVIAKHKVEHPDKIKATARRYRDGNKEKISVYAKRWQTENKEKARAERFLRTAISQGKIVKPECCEECGRPSVQGHHDDYSKPLEVRWLCYACHWRVDVQRRERELEACNV